MRRGGQNAPGGEVTVEDRNGVITQFRTFTCAHGNEIVRVMVGQATGDAGGYCSKCDAYICKKCSAMQVCVPFEKWLDWKEGTRKHDTQFGRELAEAAFKASRIRPDRQT